MNEVKRDFIEWLRFVNYRSEIFNRPFLTTVKLKTILKEIK